MDMFERGVALMQAVGNAVGAALEPDSSGACGLRIDDELDVTLRYEPTPPALLLYCPVAALPRQAIEYALRRLLEANHLWEGSHGATWSLSGDEVVLSRLLPFDALEVDVVVTELGSLVDLAFAARRMLDQQGAAAAESADTVLPRAFSAGMIQV